MQSFHLCLSPAVSLTFNIVVCYTFYNWWPSKDMLFTEVHSLRKGPWFVEKSVGFDKCVVSYIHHYGIRGYFYYLQSLPGSPAYSALPLGPWVPGHDPSLQLPLCFSRMLESCSAMIFSLASLQGFCMSCHGSQIIFPYHWATCHLYG